MSRALGAIGSTLCLLAIAASCRRALDNPADAQAPSYSGEASEAEVGSNLAASIGDTLLFEGAFTGEPGRVASFAWDFDGDGALDWESASEPSARHAFATPGEYEARFVVRGVVGDESSTTLSVTITDRTPSGSIGPDATIAPGERLSSIPLVSDDGTVIRYDWDLDGDGVYELSRPQASSVSYVWHEEGEHVIAMRATDEDGRAAILARRVVVCAAPRPVSSPSPTDGERVSTRPTLRWEGGEGCAGPLTYDLLLDQQDPPLRYVLRGASSPEYHAGFFAYGLRLWWQVITHDAVGRSVASPIFTFKTRDRPEGMGFFPPGTVVIGSNLAADESPQHDVFVDGFYIAHWETTREEYAAFLNATGYVPGGSFRADYPAGTGRYPVTNVTWHDAVAYADWAGRRLPTEAEWEAAARDGAGALFPWGSQIPTVRRQCSFANWAGLNAVPCEEGTVSAGSRPDGDTPRFFADMAGNAAEWVADWYDPTYYGEWEAQILPQGPASGTLKVVRGGSWRNSIWECTTTRRTAFDPDFFSDEIGFRCALRIDPEAASR